MTFQQENSTILLVTRGLPADRWARLRRGGNAVVVAALVGVGGVGLAGPAAASTTTPDRSFAALRAAHFSPTTPGVDLYLGSLRGGTANAWISGVHYGAVSPYGLVKPGRYEVAVRPHGASATSRPILSWTLDAHAGRAYTVAGVGSGSNVRGVVLTDDLSAPPPGQGRVRVIQAASRASKLTVRAAGGPVIVGGEAFASASAYRSVAAGHWKLTAVSDSNSAIRASADVLVRAGQTESVLVLDAAGGGITVRTLLDSAAPGAMPKGPVNAGGGGTATTFTNAADDPHAAYWASVIVAMLAVAGGTVARLRRRRALGARTTA